MDIKSERRNVFRDFIDRWYKATAPEQPPLSASLEKRDVARRGKIASILLLMTISIMLFILFPTGIILLVLTARFTTLLISLTMLLICSFLILLNRRGLTSIVGLVLILGNDIGNSISIISGGKVSLANIQLFDSLVISLLFAVALLPIISIFFVAIGNVLVTAGILYFVPHEPAVNQLIPTIISRNAVIQIGVAVIAYLLVWIMKQAIARADRAEEINKLQSFILEKEHAVAQQKHQLDVSIQEILQVQMAVSNGNLRARVPLTQNNVLWEVAGSLNNLLNRLQRALQEIQELRKVLPRIEHAVHVEQVMERIDGEIAKLTQEVQEATKNQRPIQYNQGRIIELDPLIGTLNGKKLIEVNHSLEKNLRFAPPKFLKEQ